MWSPSGYRWQNIVGLCALLGYFFIQITVEAIGDYTPAWQISRGAQAAK
jgi:hypothetical protein